MASGINRRTPASGLMPSGGEPSAGWAPSGAAGSKVAPRGGTLASAQVGVSVGVTPDPAPDVLFVDPRPLGGTLPSEKRHDDRLSRPPARGIAPRIVVLLVVLALAVGAALGWVAGHRG